MNALNLAFLGVNLVLFGWHVRRVIVCGRLLRDVHRMHEEFTGARDGILLPGWTCPKCQAFNGEAVRTLHECRACGAARSRA